MSEKASLHGLNCPNCGGIVPVPEGHLIVHCPYCDLRSYVRGERGLRRYQVPLRIPRQAALDAWKRFLGGNMAIARDAGRKARLSEAFIAFLPFWTIWARVAGWGLGQKKVGSGDSSRYEAREVKVVQEMTWNGAACDVGEFGVTQVPPVEERLEPFNPDSLHSQGLVFEPVGSSSQALEEAEGQFNAEVHQKVRLDRLAQLFVRILHSRFALVYHPLWVLRYLYRERAFQVVVDGFTGKVLYGKAPGNTLYRAAVLVGGMALGAFLAVDGPSLMVSLAGDSDEAGGPLTVALILLVAGLGIMGAAYRAFRHGEQYEFRSARTSRKIEGPGSGMNLITQVKDLEMLTQVKGLEDLEKWLNR